MRCARRQFGSHPLLMALVLALSGLMTACATEVRPEDWLEAVSRAHEAADQAMASGDLSEARRQLEAVLRSPAPAGLAEADRRVVLQDVHFRLAEIALQSGRPAEALATADAALELGRGGDLFTANLHLARGRALEALGEDVAAVEAYYEALRINDALLREQLRPIEREVGP